MEDEPIFNSLLEACIYWAIVGGIMWYGIIIGLRWAWNVTWELFI